MLQLEKYLGLMKKEEDVRGLNRKMFKLESYWYFNDVEELVNDLYCDSMYFWVTLIIRLKKTINPYKNSFDQ